MRGGSALDQALATIPDVKARVFVVWLPVLLTDRVPWRPTRRPMTDPRVVQFWDPSRDVSERYLALARAHPEWLEDWEREALAGPDALVWDVVMVWPPGAQWDDLPAPSWRASPVVDGADQIGPAILAASRGAPDASSAPTP